MIEQALAISWLNCMPGGWDPGELADRLALTQSRSLTATAEPASGPKR